MRWRLPPVRGFLVCAVTLLLIAEVAQSERLIFLSTQLRPIGEAQKLRNSVLKDCPQEVDYVTARPQEFVERVKAEQQGATHSVDAVGALLDARKILLADSRSVAPTKGSTPSM